MGCIFCDAGRYQPSSAAANAPYRNGRATVGCILCDASRYQPSHRGFIRCLTHRCQPAFYCPGQIIEPVQYYSRLTPSSAAANAPWVHSVIDTLLPTSVLLPRADRRTCPVHSQHHIGTGMPPCDVFSVTLAVISPLLPLLTHHIGTGVPPWGVSSVMLAVISPTSLIQHIVANVSRCCLDLRSLLPV